MREIEVWVQDKGDGSCLRLQWIDPLSGKRKTRTTETRDQEKAEKRRAELQEQINRGGGDLDFSMTWKGFRELFLEEYAGDQREKSRVKYETVFDVFQQICNPTHLYRAATERAIGRFLEGMRRRGNRKAADKVGLAAWTKKNYLVALKTAFRWAADQGLIRCCPKFPTIKTPKKRPQPVPEEDFEKLLRIAPDALWRAYFLFGWYEGLRLGEALELRRKRSDDYPWLDLEAKRIHLPANFQKNGEDDWLPLHPVVADAIAALPPSEDERVFAFHSRKGGGLLSRAGVSNKVILLARKAGVKLSMHRLRKGFGCRVAKQLGKGNAPILHRLLRHSSMQVTMDFYASVDDALEDALKELK